MNRATTDDVLDLLDAGTTAAAAGAAMELGLFWVLETDALPASEIAARLGIPPLRCGYWLQLLAEAGLLVRDGDAYCTSEDARVAILRAYTRHTWSLLAEEARERLQAVVDLPRRLAVTPAEPGSADDATSTYGRMAGDEAAANRFTRMLHEVHGPLARALAARLDLGGATRLMDLGGGSGVMALELVRRHPSLSATVVDVGTVCAAGRKILAGEAMADRVSFHDADFSRDPLPAGFDIVLECDVNAYDEELLRKVAGALNPGGRFLIVDDLAPSPGDAAPSRVHWAFTRSMLDPSHVPPSIPEVRARLERTGFSIAAESRLNVPPVAGSQLARDLVVIDARPGSDHR